MKTLFKRNLLRIAILVAMTSLAVTFALSGSLASLSAEYKWTTDMGKAGIFDFQDTEYTLDLFEDFVYPGNNGQTTITIPDFDENSVEWTFSEQNDRSMPVVFYISDSTQDNIVVAYSKYDFSTYTNLFVKLGNAYYSCASVSSDSVGLVSAIEDNVTLGWVWPSCLYSDQEGTVAECPAYNDYNAALCAAKYTFLPKIADFLNTYCVCDDILYSPTHIATSQITGGYQVESVKPAEYSILNDILTISSIPATVFSNNAFIAGDSADINANSCYILFIKDSKIFNATDFVQAATTAGVKIELSTQRYELADTAMTVSDGGTYALIKIFSNKSETAARPEIGLCITATVTKK